jgi:hypothetical protein
MFVRIKPKGLTDAPAPERVQAPLCNGGAFRSTGPHARYVMKRIGQFMLVLFIGINLAYLSTHATPIDPVELSV